MEQQPKMAQAPDMWGMEVGELLKQVVHRANLVPLKSLSSMIPKNPIIYGSLL